VQLRHVERRDAGDLLDARARFVDEHADAAHAGRGECGRRSGRDVARARR
jgi:hypothetical protein